MVGRSPILTCGLLLTATAALCGTVASIVNNTVSVRLREQGIALAATTFDSGNQTRTRAAQPIGAVGLVEPASQEIKIGTNISATVTQVFVAPGIQVKRGDPLFALDTRMVQALLLQRRRDLATAEARLALAHARVPGLEAEAQAALTAVQATQAEHDEAADLVRIADGLNKGDTITARESTRRKNALRTAGARLSEARAKYALAQANLGLYVERSGGASIALEIAAVEQARAALRLAEFDLELRTICAPDDGTVLQVNVRPGEFAQAGALLQPLVILGAMEPLHVRVDIDEADIPHYRLGATATAFMRGTSRQRLSLKYVRIEPLIIPKRALSGQALERVDTRVMQVLYEVSTDKVLVLPGQQLDVLIEGSDSTVQAARLSSD